MAKEPTAVEVAAAEYGFAARRLERARKARAEAEGNASTVLWNALNADVIAAEAWVNVSFAKLLNAS